ncbi:MAG: TetR/AcrR family transcriptional regulator [Clostridiales Family XIII bacterium]|jgi:AcrR family transcriptional regulator|nr:TetR/AcrR family transcriptional regulator [Clostridiales Family XIII bacterium]
MDGLTATQQKLLDAGRAEFLEKGFKSASLRNIVKQAGFTLGAFYGYYPDKASLFEALAEPAAGELVDMFRQAQDAHFDLLPKGETVKSRALSTRYLSAFLDFIYKNFDAFKLIVCCADGTNYEGYLHRLVEIEVDRTEQYYAILRESGKARGEVSREVHHMLTSAYFDAVFETVRHNMPIERAKEHIAQLSTFFNCGWDGLIKIL